MWGSRMKNTRICRPFHTVWEYVGPWKRPGYEYMKSNHCGDEKMIDEQAIEERMVVAGPDRVWDGREGIPAQEAKERGIAIDYCLVRKDAWVLGCPKEHRTSAEMQWADEWKKIYLMRRDGSPALKLDYSEWRMLEGKE